MRAAFDPARPRCPVPTVGRIVGALGALGSEKSETRRSDFGERGAVPRAIVAANEHPFAPP
jgi:hypothetical protein